jgi:5-methylcytosine-specific restriction endonuclease McrA
MRKRTKALDISPAVKKAVWERDGGKCILCHNPDAAPVCHYISRGQGGLGIPENIFTACGPCHHAYDQGAERRALREEIRAYLMAKYPGWDEIKLYYRKWERD